MKRILLSLIALLGMATLTVHAELVWKAGEALITSASQISSTPPQSSQFGVDNLIRPESDGVGTGQYIFHTAWSGSNVISRGTDPYLQFHFNKAEQHIIFSMIGSAWVATYDTPTMVLIQATNDPDGDWTDIITLSDMEQDFTSFTPERYTSPHIDLGAEYTNVRFLVKKTYANRNADGTANTGLLLSLGRFQIYEAYEGEVDPVDPKDNINLLFIGNSITYGATLSSPTTQAPPVICRSLVEEATGVTTNLYNGGHSGITTLGFLPGRDDFTRVVNSAKAFVKNNGGLTYFSIMLGTNDSACNGTEGAPVSNATYAANIRKIIDGLIEAVPTCKIVLNYPIWYSPNTYNGAMYMREGMERLHGYYPLLDAIVEEYDQVFAGNRGVWDYFEDNKVLFTSEAGNAGTFFLHPNVNGARRLAEIWTNSLLQLIEADGVQIQKPLSEWTTFIPQPDRAYYISTPRGDYGTKDGYLTNTVRTSLGATKGLFAFVTRDSLTYLYSVSDKQFVYRDPVPYRDDWSNANLSNYKADPVKVHYTGINSTYPYCLTSNGYIFNTSVDTQQGVCLNSWANGTDGGNQTAITEAAVFDPTEAQAALDYYFQNQVEVQYNVYDSDGNLLETQTATGLAGEEISTLPDNFQRKGYTTYEVQEPVAISKDAENIVNVTATWKLPFETSPDIKNVHWYNLALRGGNDFVTADNNYKCNLKPTKEQLNSLSYQWAFQGNPFDGIVVYNRTSQLKTLARNTNSKAVLRYGTPYKWKIVESGKGFLLASADDAAYSYINEYGGAGGALGFWNNVSDEGSIFSVCEVGSRLSVDLSTGASMKIIKSDPDKANGCAVLIIPGGGYSAVAGNYEGADWAPIYSQLGYTVAVLKYTVPPTAPDGPMNEALEAMQYLRDNGQEWNVSNGEIGVMGFSAGGHLASTVATHTTGAEKPVFQVLFYPVITMDAGYTHSGSRQNLLGSNPSSELVTLYSNEKQVTSDTPPAYICWANNDGVVPIANSTNYAAALRKASVPVHTKSVPTGGHGFGFNTSYQYHQEIVDDLTQWLTDFTQTLTPVARTVNASPRQDTYYNLLGQPVSQMQHGIYISNGKKVAVK